MTNLYKLVLSQQTEAEQSSYLYRKQSDAWDNSGPSLTLCPLTLLPFAAVTLLELTVHKFLFFD